MPRKTNDLGKDYCASTIASMRPRPDAAENFWDMLTSRLSLPASMRPRPDAAENADYRELLDARLRASMRPRPDAAENNAAGLVSAAAAPSFNEAAARCRGKLRSFANRKDGTRGFNEAAARCRGKHPPPPTDDDAPPAASMRPRPDAAENLGGREAAERRRHASMRPRPDAAENRRPRLQGGPNRRLQ